jgi:hypothetical protein
VQQAWAEHVGELSGGRIKVEMLPVGSIVEYSETLDAVGAGILSGHITDSSYFTGKDPAFALIGNPVGARQAQRDVGERPGPTSAEKARIRDLERENRELRQANEILKKASAYFAQAELDRPFRK